MNFSIDECHNFQDHRGNLVEFISENFLEERTLPFGQIYLVTFEQKGVIRGNHYHEHSSESFLVVHGEVEIVLEDVRTRERFSQIFKAEDTPVHRITVGPKIAHTIKSLSQLAIVISYSSRVYDPADQDKFYYSLV